MAYTYSKIAEYTVGSGGAASIDFTNIPQNYTDLKLILCSRTTRNDVSDVVQIKFDGSATNISMRYLQGTGSGVSSSSSATYIWSRVDSALSTSNTFGNAEFYIPNYAGSTNKSVFVDGVSENNATEAYTNIVAGLWSNTTAITSISLSSANSENFVQYSTAYLYGIRATEY